MKHLLAGQTVVLNSVPDELLHGLPPEDQATIVAAVGTPIVFVEYHADPDRAEFEFKDHDGDTHFIWIRLNQLDVA